MSWQVPRQKMVQNQPQLLFQKLEPMMAGKRGFIRCRL
jgi:hypothetical protein